MHLLIDVREACNPRKTGKGMWTERLVRALIARGVPMTLLTDSALPDGFPRPPHVTVRRFEQRGLRWHLAAARLAKASPGTTYFATTSFIVPFLIGRSASHVIVVHDMIAFRGEPHDRKAVWIERLTLRRAAMTAKHIVTISDTSRTDLLQRYPALSPKRVTAIYSGPIHPSTARPEDREGKTILCVGTLCPRKNQLGLVRAYAGLPEDLRTAHPLVLVGGRGWNDQPILDAVKTVPQARWLGYVDDATMQSLYDDAMLIALPSHYEGFGLPVLDAMLRGIPVMTSDRGSLKEIAGDAAVVVDPNDTDAIRDGLRRMLTDISLRASCRAKGLQRAQTYTWERTAELFVNAIR